MSYLIRVHLPDTPGSLGELAEAFGLVDADIRSVDIVQMDREGVVTDDIVVELPTGTLVDALITAAASVRGVEVDSIRPFTGTVDRRGQIQMLARIAEVTHDVTAAAELVSVMPQAMTSSWAVVLRETPDGLVRVAASQAAPGDDGTTPQLVDVTTARILHPEDDTWAPESWWLLETTLAITPLKGTDLVLVVGRVGGPDFLASEVAQIGDLGQIIGAMLR
ncbi:amino acid-binding ACT domain protein [Corynebacterium liangguodongii]|uniref:Amino acid-binding ACT domain protein n=1 Tax=Corynebacterium liangguodongii TaxID=2079535 RepID=A0A2S0WDL6_9CORY|nr:amino acid-binding ACT domain protein [Corynebacterium liangguodongii]AWB83856.1 amino acid-binding ACT domain protein [Corynebacterium liangguodongii]PWB98976.1 amino acid-binding ACT domain protein [Corynebacterium liangguodongii]